MPETHYYPRTAADVDDEEEAELERGPLGAEAGAAMQPTRTEQKAPPPRRPR